MGWSRTPNAESGPPHSPERSSRQSVQLAESWVPSAPVMSGAPVAWESLPGGSGMARANRLVATLALATACQTYDFEPVKPLSVAQDARSVPLAFNRPKPNLMILEDKSG